VSSVNYPEFYPVNVSCVLYTFIGDHDEIVEITFAEFDLQVPFNNRLASVTSSIILRSKEMFSHMTSVTRKFKKKILMNFFREVERRPRNSRLDFGSDPGSGSVDVCSLLALLDILA